MPILCLHCAAQMPETAAFCPGCGRPTAAKIVATEKEKVKGKVSIFPENIAAALGYFTFVPAIVFLLRTPFNRNRFVRFHSIQCLLLWAVALAAVAVLRLAGLVLFYIPLGPLLAVLIDALATLAACLIWIVLVVKALQGEMFKLPVLGGFAEQYSVTP
jgi:uncharacterized membrane protein